MKQLKSFFAIVLMSMMFANVATAQTTKVQSPTFLTSNEIAAIRATLTSTPAASMGMLPEDSTYFVGLLDTNNTPLATRVAVSGQLCGAQVEAGDSVRLFIVRRENGFNLFCDVIRPVEKEMLVKDSTLVLQIDSAAIHSQFVEKQLEGRPRYRTDFVSDKHVISDGHVIEKASDKFGLSLLGGGTYQMGNGLNSFSGEVGFNYSIANTSGQWFVMPEVLASLRVTKYNNNANQAGEKYWSYATEATLFGGVALGNHGTHRIAIGAGLGWEFYKTDSQARYYENGSWDEMTSEGNYIYPQAKIRYMYDMFNGPVSFFGGVGIRQHKSVWQNSSAEKSWMLTFELGFQIKLIRHLNNNK